MTLVCLKVFWLAICSRRLISLSLTLRYSLLMMPSSWNRANMRQTVSSARAEARAYNDSATSRRPRNCAHAAIARYCAAADLFVLPSLLEALPTVAVEALASGTPVLSSGGRQGR